MYTVVNASVDILKVHPRNTEFFDDIQGEAYENFKDSIQRKGILSPLIVTTDMTVISGHQRLKAARELGIENVPVDVRDDIKDENDKLEMLLVANFGREKNDEAKKRKIAVQYVELKGLKHGQKSSDYRNSITQEQIAKELGISKSTLNELLDIERKLTPELKEILDSGGINKTTASKLLVKLSPEEQTALLEDLGKDRLAEMTQKQVQEYIDKIKGLEKAVEGYKSKIQEQENNPIVEELMDEKDAAKAKEREWYEKAEKYKREVEEKERELNKLKSQNPEVKEVVIEKVPDDYESFKRRAEVLVEENLRLSKESNERQKELDILKTKNDKIEQIPKGVVQKHDWPHFEEISNNYEMLINPYMYMKKYFEELPLEEKYLYITKLDTMFEKINKIKNLIKGE